MTQSSSRQAITGSGGTSTQSFLVCAKSSSFFSRVGVNQLNNPRPFSYYYSSRSFLDTKAVFLDLARDDWIEVG